MTIELDKEARKAAVVSIEKYFAENFAEEMAYPIGNVQAGALLGFFLAEIGPCVYNQAVRDVQENLQARVMEIDFVVYEEEFKYWDKLAKKR